MKENKGGRGHKAPYETTHSRIPKNIKRIVDSLSNSYKEYVNESGCIKFNEAYLLPSIPAIYIVFDEAGILFIGQNKNLSQRWNSQYLLKDIKEVVKKDNFSIAWINCSNESLLTSLQSVLMRDLVFNSDLEYFANETLDTATQNKLLNKTIRVCEESMDKKVKLAKIVDESTVISDHQPLEDKNMEQAIKILNKSLSLPANKGGAIKREIKEVIKILAREAKHQR